MKMCSLCQLKDMRERFIERKFVEAVKKKGGFAPKFVSQGLDGMPDRIVLFPIGKIAFVELKAPGENMVLCQEKVQIKCNQFSLF